MLLPQIPLTTPCHSRFILYCEPFAVRIAFTKTISAARKVTRDMSSRFYFTSVQLPFSLVIMCMPRCGCGCRCRCRRRIHIRGELKKSTQQHRLCCDSYLTLLLISHGGRGICRRLGMVRAWTDLPLAVACLHAFRRACAARHTTNPKRMILGLALGLIVYNELDWLHHRLAARWLIWTIFHRSFFVNTVECLW